MNPPIYELELVNFSIRQNHREALNQHMASMARQQRRETDVITALRRRIMETIGSVFPNGNPDHDPREARRTELAPPEGRSV